MVLFAFTHKPETARKPGVWLLQTVEYRTQNVSYSQVLPFPWPRTNRKQASLSDIQAHLSDTCIQANQNPI